MAYNTSKQRIVLTVWAVMALGFLASGAASAGTYYVTPTGAGLADGSNWANAFSNVQDAVNAVAGAGDAIRLKAGTYALTNALAITAKPSFTLAGGYAGGEDPDALSGDPSILKPAAAGTRVIAAANTTFALERLTVAQGNYTGNGGGIYLTNCVTTLRSLVVRENTANGIVVYGGAIYAKGGALTLRDSTVCSNRLVRTAVSDLSAMGLYGAGLFCQGVSLTVSNSTIRANGFHDGERVSNYNSYGYGGGLYVDGGSLAMRDSLILDNYVQNHRARNGKSYGGGLYANNTSPMRVSSTRFSGNGCQADSTWPDGGASQPIAQEGGALYLAGSSLVAVLEDCVVIRNAGVAGVGGAGDLRIAGGSVAMTNCLVALNAQGGVIVAGGSVAIANSTVADNTGWGIRRTGGTVSVKDSIVWGNMLGGIDGAASVSFSCTQEVRAGNQNADPLLVGDYYLSAAGLPGQTVNSPCINAGSDAAATLGLGALTTQTDGVSDGGVVDLGYHYATAFGGDLLNRFLFVDAANGDDVNNQGRVPGSGGAFKTIRKALSVAVRDTVITLAAGDYNAASGETFPLTVADAHLTLQGAGPNATRIDAGSAARALFAVAPGRLKLAGLTVQNGRLQVTTTDHATLRGAGLHALGGDLTVSNCLFKGNSIHATVSVSGEMLYLGGAGIFVTGGGLKMIDSSVRLNTITRGTGSAYGYYNGGGVYAEDTVVTAQRTSFVSNRLDSMTTANYYFYLRGAAMYLRNGSSTLSDCSFTDNRINLAHTLYRDGFGAALCAERTRPVSMQTSTFSGNWAGPLKSTTDNRYRLRGGTIFLFNSSEGVMDRCSILNGDTALYSDDHGGVEIDYAGGGNSLPIPTATLRMTNCLVAANADSGVAARGAKARLNLVNCTVAGNTAWGARNHTVGALLTIRNSIIWGNASGGISTNAGDTVNYTLAQELHPGTQNKSVDPLFVAPGTGNYRLQEGSPAWNAGLDAGWMVAATDLDDNPRLAGTVDLGCYEIPPPGGTVILVR